MLVKLPNAKDDTKNFKIILFNCIESNDSFVSPWGREQEVPREAVLFLKVNDSNMSSLFIVIHLAIHTHTHTQDLLLGKIEGRRRRGL